MRRALEQSDTGLWQPERLAAAQGVARQRSDVLSRYSLVGHQRRQVRSQRGRVMAVRTIECESRVLAPRWVRNYRRDRPGSGYVQLYGFGATIDRLPLIRAAVEYGLLVKAR